MLRGKILALDFGKARIGYALGFSDVQMAIPKGVFKNEGEGAIKQIVEYADENSINSILIGYPINLNQSDEKNEIMKAVDKFVISLKKEIKVCSLEIEVGVYDEGLTTFEAESKIRELELQTGEKTTLPGDAIAAQIILERFFDSQGE